MAAALPTAVHVPLCQECGTADRLTGQRLKQPQAPLWPRFPLAQWPGHAAQSGSTRTRPAIARKHIREPCRRPGSRTAGVLGATTLARTRAAAPQHLCDSFTPAAVQCLEEDFPARWTSAPSPSLSTRRANRRNDPSLTGGEKPD